MRSTLIPITISICVLVTGCSIFTRSIERPTAEVRGVSVSSAGLTGVSGELRLDVTNPNGFGVPLAGIDWELSIGGARAVTGTVSLSQTIPARGVAPVTTSLTIDVRDAIAVASELASGARGYRIAARLRFSTPVGPLEVSVEHSGLLGGTGELAAITEDATMPATWRGL
jgi:LEA14-like dessication related protein